MKHLILLFMITLLTSCKYPAGNEMLNVLVFSKTVGYRHESIASGVEMLTNQAAGQKWNLTATEDPTLFNDIFLAGVDVVVFLNPSGDGLNAEQEAAFEKFIRSGKGFVGIHSSADFEYDWDWYRRLNGAHFKVHPPSQEGTLVMEDTTHPAMKPFEGMATYTTYDEWYTFKTNPRPDVHVLATLDESSIKVSENDEWKMGDHPIIWWQEFEGSRSFYTGLGHTHEAFREAKIIQHITAAINWAGYRK